MPEGDTVWLAGRRLHDALAGRPLTRSDFRVPQLATVDLAGRTVTEVVSRGKHLLTRVDDDLTLHTHFRMDGSWHLYRHGDRWHGGPEWQVRVLLENAGWQAVGYRLPVVELLPRDREADAVGHLGPDVLGPDWDTDEAVRRLSADPDREVGDALLDQRNLAGIGNLYKTESLFLHGITPWTRVGDVPDLPRLVDRAARLLEANKDTVWQVTTGDPRRGRGHWAFERGGRPCLRCGTPVASAEQGRAPYQRISYWCPSCQQGPAPAPAPVRRSDRPSGRTRYRP
jgi:formamidopyrimidine-DNA glycosylase